MPRMTRLLLGFATNAGLLLAGTTMAASGLLLQGVYHIGHDGDADKHTRALGINYGTWSDTHVMAMLVVSFLVLVHTALHWKWYQTIIRRKLFAKNQLVITLTFIFAVVAITGYVPWLIGLTGGSEVIRKAFIEVHDKIALALLVYLAIHTTRTFSWFVRSARTLKQRSVEDVGSADT